MRDRLEEASGKAVSQSLSRAFSGNHAFGVTHAPTAYKAQSPGKLAFMPSFWVQHNEAPDSEDRVNAAVV